MIPGVPSKRKEGSIENKKIQRKYFKAAILDKIFGTKQRNRVKLDRSRKV